MSMPAWSLRDLDELVRLVCLLDGARPADHRRDAAGLKQSRFGTEGHDVGLVGPGQFETS
jgi:hypothetical protein